MADLCTGVFLGIPLTISSALDRWIFGDIMCAAGAFMRIFFNIAALLSLFAVTVDRFLAIAYPLRYPALMTRKKAIVILTLIWTTGAFIALLYGPILTRTPVYHPQSVSCIFASMNPEKIDMSIIICVTVFVLSPFITTIILYSRIYCITRRHTKFMSRFVAPRNKQVNRNMKFVKTFTLVIVCFSIAWLPSVIIRFMQQLSDIVIPSQLYMLSEILIISNSGVNIFIYYWRNQDFKKAAVQKLRSLVSFESMSFQKVNLSSGSSRSNRSACSVTNSHQVSK
ncbi:alpha-1A adrenergic receptor-like [Amphiura filiformis]|uniref:alpha-1A adrenergic receptor-like n=1 Tax=Amphiura filiformis TaxID=82378 RepID=UPI003B223EF0